MNEIYIARSDKQIGPFSEEQITGMIATGVLAKTDKAWTKGMVEWGTLEDVLLDKNAMPEPPVMPEPSVQTANLEQADFSVHSGIPIDEDARNGQPVSEPYGFDPDYVPRVFYPISTGRFLFLTLISHGLFLNYWAYRNWKYIRYVEKERVAPEMRGIFFIFTIFQLTNRINRKTNDFNTLQGKFSAWLILFGTIFLYLLNRAPLGIIYHLVLMALVALLYFPLVTRIRSLNDPSINWDKHDHWSSGKVLCLIVGVIFYAWGIIAPFFKLAHS